MIGIAEFGRLVYDTVERYGRATVARQTIDAVYGKQIYHHPMYFPMPGMPSPCSTLDDFKEWAKAQGYSVIQPLDIYDRVIVVK